MGLVDVALGVRPQLFGLAVAPVLLVTPRLQAFRRSLGLGRSSKLDRARSRLYRGQILQENMRLKALAEIYTMHSFAQLCNRNFLSKF